MADPYNGYDLSGNYASYASDWHQSRGRQHQEEDKSEQQDRTTFQHDRDRIVHSPSFRRLMHKTQVFINPEVDHYRTRLTHTLEVAQIARSVARCLRVDEDLTEAIALAHDLGHSPFGHTGELALQECMDVKIKFDHNGHTLRLVTLLEKNYLNFPGLNLSWETLEGLIKHNGPIAPAKAEQLLQYPGVDRTLSNLQDNRDFALASCASIEAQIAAIADDIAYSFHDLEDGLVAEMIKLDDLVADIPQLDEYRHKIERRIAKFQPTGSHNFMASELKRTLIHETIVDLLATTRAALIAHNVTISDQVRQHQCNLVTVSAKTQELINQLKKFMHQKVYQHDLVNSKRSAAQSVTRELFGYFLQHINELPENYRKRILADDYLSHQIAVKDYIAGMTDHFALKQYQHKLKQKPPAALGIS